MSRASSSTSSGASPDPDQPEHPSRAPRDPALDSGARLWSRTYIDLLVAQALFGFSYALFVLLPKLLAVSYGGDAGDIGLIMAAFGAASLLIIPGVSPVMKVLGRRRVMILSSLLLAGSAFGFLAIAKAGWAAAALRGLHGIAWSLTFAAGMSLVADCAPPARLGQAIGFYGAAALVMNALAPAIAEPIAARFGARPVFLLSAAIALACAAYCRRLPARGKVIAPDTGGSAASARALAPAFIVLAIGGLATIGMYTFIAPFALSHGISVVRGFFIAYTASALAVRMGGARLVDRLGHRLMAFMSTAAYGLIVIATGLAGPEHLTLLGGLFGLAHGVVFPALMAIILGDSAPADRPRMLAIANGAINLGVVGVGLLGAAAQKFGYTAVFTATGTLTFAAALLLALPPTPASSSSTWQPAPRR